MVRQPVSLPPRVEVSLLSPTFCNHQILATPLALVRFTYIVFFFFFLKCSHFFFLSVEVCLTLPFPPSNQDLFVFLPTFFHDRVTCRTPLVLIFFADSPLLWSFVITHKDPCPTPPRFLKLRWPSTLRLPPFSAVVSVLLVFLSVFPPWASTVSLETRRNTFPFSPPPNILRFPPLPRVFFFFCGPHTDLKPRTSPSWLGTLGCVSLAFRAFFPFFVPLDQFSTV